MSRNNNNHNMESESDWRSGLGYSTVASSTPAAAAGHPAGGGRSNNSNPPYNSTDVWPNGYQNSTVHHQSSVHSYQSQHQHYHHHYQQPVPPTQPPPVGYPYYDPSQYYPPYGGYQSYPPTYPSSSYPYPQDPYHQSTPYYDYEASHYQAAGASRASAAEYPPSPPRANSPTFVDDSRKVLRDHKNVADFERPTTSRNARDYTDPPMSTKIKEADDDDDGFEFEEIDYSITNGHASSSSPPSPSEVPEPDPVDPPVNGLGKYSVTTGLKKRVRFDDLVSFHEPSASQSKERVRKDQPVKSGSLNSNTESRESKKRVTFDVPHCPVPLDEVLSDLSPQKKSSSKSSPGPGKSRKVVEESGRFKRKRPTREADDDEGGLVEFLGRTNSRVSSRCYAKAKASPKKNSKDSGADDDSSTLSSASEGKDKVTTVPALPQSISSGGIPEKIHIQVSHTCPETESGDTTTHDDETILPASVENIDSPPSPASLVDIVSSEPTPPESSSYDELENALAALHSESPLPESTGNIEAEPVTSKMNAEIINIESPENIEEDSEEIVDAMNSDTINIESPENIEEEGEEFVDVMNDTINMESPENIQAVNGPVAPVISPEMILPDSPENFELRNSPIADIANFKTDQSMDVDVEDVSDCDDNEESEDRVFDIRIRTDIFEDDVSDS